MNILVLDVGTSSMRGVLYGDDGKALFTHQVPYRVNTVSQTIVEQAPCSWVDAMTEICREAAGSGHSVDALSLTCQRSSIIPVDKTGAPLRDAIMWQDTRNASIVEELSEYGALIQQKTGARLNTVFSGSKMTWLRRNEQSLYKKSHKICTIADYLTWQITGAFVTDATYGSRSLLMDLQTRAWDGTLLDLFEVERDKLCELIEPGSISGTVTAAFAARTGLRSGIPLISAGGDQQCGALGQGILKPGTVEATFGTGAYLLQYSETVPDDLRGDVICGVHAVPGAYVLESSMLTCAALYDWGQRILFPNGGLEEINAAIAETPIGANGVTVLPYFQGRGTPDWNNNARGAFLNLSLSTTKADMARALLEAIALETQNNAEALERYTEPFQYACAGGGLTKQPVFCQMLSDVMGRPVVRSNGHTEQTAHGAWISAAATLGLYADHEKAYQQTVQTKNMEQFLPDPVNHIKYETLRQQMNGLYRRL